MEFNIAHLYKVIKTAKINKLRKVKSELPNKYTSIITYELISSYDGVGRIANQFWYAASNFADIARFAVFIQISTLLNITFHLLNRNSCA